MKVSVNNEFYKSFGERWYSAVDDPVAILRAETKVKFPWVLQAIRDHYGEQPVKVLDAGCGGGLLSNPLADAGLRVTGLDIANDCLDVARRHDITRTVEYVQGDALALPFPDASFDVVTAMDVLEHLEEPAQAVQEAARVLKPGGLFLFHTINRNWVSRIVAIKLIEWLVKNTPERLHVHRLFIKPAELRDFCSQAGLSVEEIAGLRPKFSTIPLRAWFSGEVPPSLEFTLTRSLLISYIGSARKLGN